MGSTKRHNQVACFISIGLFSLIYNLNPLSLPTRSHSLSETREIKHTQYIIERKSQFSGIHWLKFTSFLYVQPNVQHNGFQSYQLYFTHCDHSHAVSCFMLLFLWTYANKTTKIFISELSFQMWEREKYTLHSIVEFCLFVCFLYIILVFIK